MEGEAGLEWSELIERLVLRPDNSKKGVGGPTLEFRLVRDGRRCVTAEGEHEAKVSRLP
jgi:hypothetical protein